jgi:hypothetical protein
MTILGKMAMCQLLNTRVPEDITEEATNADGAEDTTAADNQENTNLLGLSTQNNGGRNRLHLDFLSLYW